MKSIALGADSLRISQGGKYILNKSQRGMATARYVYYSSCSTSENIYATGLDSSGELFITKLDSINQIVSGTFWFQAVNDRGDTVKVTDGRFDMRYTR